MSNITIKRVLAISLFIILSVPVFNIQLYESKTTGFDYGLNRLCEYVFN